VERVDALRLQGMELLIGMQVPQFGQHRGAAAAQQDDADQDGRQLAQQDRDQQIAERPLLPCYAQPIDRLIDHAEPDQRCHEDRGRQAAAQGHAQHTAELGPHRTPPRPRQQRLRDDAGAERHQGQQEAQPGAHATTHPRQRRSPIPRGRRVHEGRWRVRHSWPASTKVRDWPTPGR
jgi:hypothetical protein